MGEFSEVQTETFRKEVVYFGIFFKTIRDGKWDGHKEETRC